MDDPPSPRPVSPDCVVRQGALGRFLVAAALVGAFAGLVGAAFHALLDEAQRGRDLLHAVLADGPLPGWLVLMALGAMVLTLAMWMVRRFAPEAAGSGIQEVEAILDGRRDLRWQRVLPTKFIAGVLAVGSGLVLGREGPTVHLGGALGKLVAVAGRFSAAQGRTLIAVGAAAGLATAFNAPLAAIVFVTEELREHFAYSFASIQAVILACCLAVIVSGSLLGQGPALPIQDLDPAPLAALPAFVVLGLLIGALGVLFNRLLLGSLRRFRLLQLDHAYLVAAALGLALGALLWWMPQAVGGGETLVESLLQSPVGPWSLVLLLAIRLLTTVGSYGAGLPGGIFAPLLALGTIAGAAFDRLAGILVPGYALAPGVFAVAAMGALFAATVRAPLTGIVLVIELTGALPLGLPIILTCISATFTAECLGGQPIYSQLLAQGERPPVALSRLGWRLALAGLILAALVILHQIADHGALRWPGGESVPVPAPIAVHAPADRPATAVVDEARPVPASVAAAQGRADERRLAPTDTPAEAPAPSSVVPDQGRYVIQLVSVRDPARLAPFARRFGIEGQVSTLESASGGWYPALLGRYPTRAQALAARARLPAGLRARGPIVRTLPTDARLVPVP
ncbi:H(+)/Cl(-) exchange transporter ClcA [uncultured Thiodictyon sp.]|uniref:H(+)/Cl(-) exchange transporter ClcA n=1 Tax=uncultured Thiodictyon sp. TaxID=1846217 RepID=UPI0025E06769|nr:H(+)/Cl(-) exchange transporter ClcA [uncultured Thiodictyon sp.]